MMRLALVILLAALASPVPAQDAVDASLLAEINRIRAIDNHMHGEAVDAARLTRWKDENPLGKPRYPDVVGLQRSNPGMARRLVRALWLCIQGRRAATPQGAAGRQARHIDQGRQQLAQRGARHRRRRNRAAEHRGRLARAS